jgi:hypothetical protein
LCNFGYIQLANYELIQPHRPTGEIASGGVLPACQNGILLEGELLPHALSKWGDVSVSSVIKTT